MDNVSILLLVVFLENTVPGLVLDTITGKDFEFTPFGEGGVYFT